MNSPLVSICIPTYDAGVYFEECLQSALSQTYSHVEILISDDGSTDTTLTIVKKYQQQYTHIRMVRNAHRGLVSNWNNCIAEAKGEWIKFLFQDDILMPSCIEKMLAACLEHKTDVGLCRRRFLLHDDVSTHIRYNFKYKIVTPERLFDDQVYISPERLAEEIAQVLPENALGEPTCYLFNKRIFGQTGTFNPDFHHTADLEFILRLGLVNGLVFLSEALAVFRVHGESATSANLKTSKDSIIRHIAAIDGDNILLLHEILHNPAFGLLKEAMGEKAVRLRLNHYYHSGCKHKGAGLFNKALAPIREKYQELGSMRYNLFRYFFYRKQYKKWLRENR